MSLGLCQPRIPGTVGAEPFSAKIRYTGPDDPDYPNLIKLTVTMPHMDGECHHLHSHVDLIHLQYLTEKVYDPLQKNLNLITNIPKNAVFKNLYLHDME